MKTLSIEDMQWTGGNPTAVGALACGAAAFLVVAGIVYAGYTGGAALPFIGSFIVDNAVMAITCISAAR